MCGQFGVIGKIGLQHEKFISDMFIMDSLRGPHSCGLTSIGNLGGVATTFKRAVPASDFIDLKTYSNVLKMPARAIIGHNRWATAGKVTSGNAHPFTIGAITGQHNGTLEGQWRLPDSKDFIVDSENIIHSINKIGIKKTWALVEGTAALVWWDEARMSLNMIRNDERPLYYCSSKGLGQIFFASEKYMLMAAAERNHIYLNKMLKVPVNTLMSFTVDTTTVVQKDVIQLNVKKLKALDIPKQTYQQSWGCGYNYSGTSQIGTRVDFIVVSVKESQFKGQVYEVEDNKNDGTYIIEAYTHSKINLKVGDCRTGRVSSIYGGSKYIASTSILDDSEFEAKPNVFEDIIEAEYEEAEEAEAAEIDAKDEEEVKQWQDYLAENDKAWLEIEGEEDTPSTDMCSWCGSAVEAHEERVTTEGDVFCETCASLSDVANFVTFSDSVIKLKAYQ